MVVQQDPAADDPLLAPGADAVDGAMGGFAVGAVDVVEGDAVVEDLFFLVAEVAQAVPLGGGLGVEGPDVVVYYARGFLVEGLVERLAVEEGEGALGVAGRGGLDGLCYFADVAWWEMEVVF